MHPAQKIKYLHYLILTIVGCMNICIAFSQTISFNKEIRLDNRSIILRNIMLDGDSLLISGEIGTDSLGLAGFFLLYMDSLGNIGTIKNYRDPSLQDHTLLDGRNPLIKNHSQNIVLGGVFLQRDDLFVMELNSNLTIKFYKEYFANHVTMYIHDVEEILGNYYFLGYIQTQNGDHDIFLQKIDSSGNKIWEKTYGVPSKDETGRAAIIEDDGLTIMVSESFDNTPTIKNDTRYWIRFMHVDTSGSIVRDWREEVTGQEGWSGTLLKYNNDYIYSTNVIGEETNFGPLVASQIVRRDSDFNLIWRKPFGEPDNHHNQIGDMIFSRDSTVLLASGNIWDATQEFTWARVMMIDLCGDLSCEVRDTGIFIPNLGSSNRLEGIVQSESGSIYTVGYTYKSSGFYEGLLLKINMDGCVDTLCNTTAVEDILRLREQKIDAYPNPMQDELYIVLDESLPPDVSVSIYNTMGHLVFSDVMDGHKRTISVVDWPVGLYVVQAISKGRVVASIKVIKGRS
jgi:hypothetical protein